MVEMDLSIPNLISCLETAGNPAQLEIRRSSEDQLKSWSAKPGFHVMLQDLYLDLSQNLQVRWLAIIYLKNSISGHWRRTSSSPVSSEEKKIIRSRAFGCIHESNRKLNAQNAAAMAKIARVDFPREWSDVFDQFDREVLQENFGANSSQDQMQALYNGLDILNQILKTLSTAKYGSILTALKEQSSPLISRISQIYLMYVNQWMVDLSFTKMEVGYKALKVASRLIYNGLTDASKNPDAVEFFSIMKSHLVGFIQLYEASPSDLLAKHLKQIGKFFSRLRTENPVAFMLIPDSIEVFHIYLQIIESKSQLLTFQGNSDDEDDETYELWNKIVVQGLNILSDQIQLVKRRGVSLKTASAEERAQRDECMRRISEDLFQPNVISQLSNLLLTQYFRINRQDLENWKTEPEEFHIEESEQERWQFQARPAATRLFMFMISAFPDLADQVMSFVSKALSQTEDVPLQECALQALQYGAVLIATKVNMDEMMIQLLALINNSDNIILRRRFCMVMAEWISVDCLSSQMKMELYNVLVNNYLVNARSDDLAVLLGATSALKSCVEGWVFEASMFAPFIDQTFNGLLELMNRLTTIECKFTVVQVLSVLIEQLGSLIAPYSRTILKILPPLWEEAGDKYYIKGVVIQTLSSLVQALRDESGCCYPLAIPAISTSCSPNSPDFLYLLEDGLALWDAVVENAKDSSNWQVIELFSISLECITEPSENLHLELVILSKTIAYCGDCQPSSFSISEFTDRFFAIISSYISSLKSDVLMSLIDVMEMVAQWFDVNDYIAILNNHSLLQTLLQQLLSPNVGVLVSLKIFNYLSRIIIQNPTDVWSIVGDDSIRCQVLDEWLEKYHNVGHPKDKKLLCLGLTALIQTNDGIIATRMSKFVDMWVDILSELSEDSDGPDSNWYYTTEELMNQEDPEVTAYNSRMIKMRKTKDPVHCVPLKSTIRHILGIDSVQQLITTLPSDVVELLRSVVFD